MQAAYFVVSVKRWVWKRPFKCGHFPFGLLANHRERFTSPPSFADSLNQALDCLLTDEVLNISLSSIVTKC